MFKGLAGCHVRYYINQPFRYYLKVILKKKHFFAVRFIFAYHYLHKLYIHTYINSYSIDRCPHNFSCSRAEFVTPPPKKLKKIPPPFYPTQRAFFLHLWYIDISLPLFIIYILYIYKHIYISENILYIHTISLRYRAIFPCCSCMYIIYYSWYYYILASFFLCLEYSRIFFEIFSIDNGFSLVLFVVSVRAFLSPSLSLMLKKILYLSWNITTTATDKRL